MKYCVFLMICGFGGSKNRLLKATGAETAGQIHISKLKFLKTAGFGPLLEVDISKKCTPLWRDVHFEVKMYKTPVSDHFY